MRFLFGCCLRRRGKSSRKPLAIELPLCSDRWLLVLCRAFLGFLRWRRPRAIRPFAFVFPSCCFGSMHHSQQWYIFDCRKFDVVQPAATAQTITCWSRRRSCSAIMVLDINCAARDVAIKLLTIIDRGGWWQPAIWLSDIESLPIYRYG